MTPSIRARIDTMCARAASAVNRAAEVRQNAPVARADAMPLGALLFDIGQIASRYAPLLVLLLVSFGCVMIAGPAFISAVYPIELEPREGTSWLHALALSRGINIFDPATVAYINMNHGPMDAIAKSFLISIFPEVSASLATRFFCTLLPLIVFASSLFLLRHREFPVLKGLVLTFITYGLIVINPTYGSFVGRSDPTALCFGFLAATVMLSSVDGRRPKFYAVGLVGLLLSLMILTNWRFIAVAPFMLIVWGRYGALSRRSNLSAYVTCFAAGLILPLLFVLYHYYAWDIVLYYKHYFGFHRPFHSFSDSIYSIAKPLVRPTWMKCLYLILSIILFAAVAVEGKNHSKIAGQRSFWVFLLVAAVMVHYLMAAVGGGAYYYMKPTLIIAWMCGIILCADVNTIRFPMLSLMSIAIVFIIVIRLVASQYSFFATVFLEAMQYTRTVQFAQAEGPIYAESHFFFLRSRIPVVDIGDYASQFGKIGYYGPAFSKIFRDNLNRLALTPPRYIIHSFVDSPELAAIIRNQYSKKQCAPKYFVDYPPPCLYRHAVQGQ